MKRTERRHLKENKVAEWVLGVSDWLGANRQAVTYTALGIGILAIAIAGTLAWRHASANRASAMLAEAMAVSDARVVPPYTAPDSGQAPFQEPGTYPTDRARFEAALPKLMAVADAYPATNAGLIARYRAGAALTGLGRFDEALQRFQEVVDRSTGVYQAMARLGFADACLTSGQYEKAISMFEEVVAKHADDAPIDGVLMELGRAYRMAGRGEDAAKAFKRVADEFPMSPYAAQARREIGS